MSHKYTRNQKCILALFLVYLGVLIYLVFFAETFRRGEGAQAGYAYNLELFKEIRRFYTHMDRLGLEAVLVNLLGNVVAFVPFAFMLPVVSPRCRGLVRTVLLTFLLSLGIECVQLVTKVGSFDVDDLLLNTVGGLVGYVLYWVVQKLRGRRNRRLAR